MKKRWKRICAAGLTVCMAVGMTACSGKEEKQAEQKVSAEQEEEKKTQENASSEQETEEKTEESKETASAGEEQEMLTFKVGYARDTSFKYEGNETMESNTWVDLYKENGILLDVMYNVETSQGEEKLSQMIMSGDYPDYMSINAKNYLDYASQGLFTDLAPYFDKYAGDLVKAYYKDTEWGPIIMDAATTTDGKLYGLPMPGAGYDSMNLLWIRKDWLENLGLEEPKTVDELFEVARAFTEDDPDGNGQDDTIGLTFNGKDVFNGIGGFDGFFQMFGVTPGVPAGTIPFVDIDGKAAYSGSNAESAKEALTMLRDMYEKGYITKDFITAGSEQVIASLSSGKAGMMFGTMANIGSAWQNVLAIQPEAHFVALGLPGVTEETWGQGFYSNTPPTFCCLSSKAGEDERYIEAFFKIMELGTYYLGQPDVLSQEEYEKYNGKAGEYTGWQAALGGCSAPNNNFVALPRHQKALETGDTSEMNVMNLRDYNSIMDYVNNKDRREELNEEELNAFNAGLFYYSVWGDKECAYAALQSMIDNGNVIFSAYEAPQTENMTANATKLDTLAKETIANIVMGNKDVSYYDEFLELWNSLGGEAATKDADEWYQAMK